MKLFKSQIIRIKKKKNLRIVEPVNIYGAEGDNTKIQSHSFICELVNIGKNCFIGHGVVFINDKFSDGRPSNQNKKKWKKTNLSSNVYIGSNSTILPVNICSNVVIGAGSVVTKNITKPGKYFGNPAKKV